LHVPEEETPLRLVEGRSFYHKPGDDKYTRNNEAATM
jgi:hypothetical protein